MGAVTFEECWALLGQDGEIQRIEGWPEVARLDYEGCDYYVFREDNTSWIAAYRTLRWQGYETFTIRNRGQHRMGEWDRLWADWQLTTKPHVYVIQYWDEGGALLVAAVTSEALRAGTQRDQWVSNLNGSVEFFSRSIHDVDCLAIWDRRADPCGSAA